MGDYPRGLRNRLLWRRWWAVSHPLAITPALSVAFVFACRCRSIALLGFPARPSPRGAPAFLAAIALCRPPRIKTPFASLQQTMARPGGAPRPAEAPGRRPVFLFFGRACRILVRAHGSVDPGSSCPGGDSHSSPGRCSGSLQKSIAASLPAARLLVFSQRAVRFDGLAFQAGLPVSRPIATLD